MARSFRFYGKKRGNRRAGSNKLGSVGEALFFAVLFLLGCGGLVAAFVFLVLPEWRVNHEFVENTCRVLQAEIQQKQTGDGVVYRPCIKIEHEVDGVVHGVKTYDIATVRGFASSYSSGREDKQEVLDRFVIGKQYTCWYHPSDPDVVVLVRGYSWWIWLIFVVPVSFMIIGGGGVIYRVFHWGKSAERRAALVQRVQDRDLFNTNGRSRRKFPNIPDDSDITNSPGTKLKFRLPISTSPGWALFGILMACLFWNGIVSIFVAIAVGGHLQGEPDWFLTLFIVPFALVGIVLLVLFIRQLLVTTGIGPTLVEISDHPLHPGDPCELFVSQSGRLAVNSLEVLLVCEEEVTYRQGTDTRTETHEVHRHQMFRREGFEIRHGMPFEAECALQVPAGVMHSFKADHSQINWKVVVQGDVAGWPDYKRSFRVIVCPPDGKDRP